MMINGIDLKWLGHASFKIKANNKIIYIDPYEVTEAEKADIILVTHEHFDHCSINDLKNLSRKGTVLVVQPDCISKVSSIDGINIIPAEPNKTYDVDDLRIETVLAYNINKQFHPKANGWLGYILNIEGKRIYHAGDTDLIPEMANIRNIDIALLPIGGTYTMNAKEAAKAANIIKPKMVIPIHYNKIQGTEANPEEFKQYLDSNIKIL